MPSTRQEQVVRLPAEIVRMCNGFSYDFGGSVLKLAYRTKEDYEEALRDLNPEHMAPVRLVSFSRQEIDEAIEFIKEHAYISRTPGQDTTVYTTGVGGFQFKANIEKELHIKILNIVEMDCFTRALNYLLKTVSRRDMTTPFDTAATNTPVLEAKMTLLPFLEAARQKKGTKMEIEGKSLADISVEDLLNGMLMSMEATGDPSKPMTETESELYPCGMVMCGSAFGMMQVTEDGTYLPCDMSNKGGRAFLGMGNVFLGCKDYSELLAWAKAGNSDNVDWCVNDAKTEMAASMGTESIPKDTDESEDAFYGILTKDLGVNPLAFSFGKCVAAKKEDFKKEDLAAALLRFYCIELSQLVDCAQRACGLRHIFLVGSFVSDEYVRHLVTAELTRRCIYRSFFGGEMIKPFDFHFLPHGAHLGALGGLLHFSENFCSDGDQTTNI